MGPDLVPNCLQRLSLLLLYADFFSKFLSGTLSVSNGLDPDQDRHSVGPDLGQNCLQRLSADNKCVCCCLLTFFKTNFFKKFFQEQYQSVKQFRSKSKLTLCRS